MFDEDDKPQSSQYRLWFFVIVVGSAYTIPHGYQIAVVNEPEDLMRAWINETTKSRFDERGVVVIWSFVVTCRMIGSVIGSIIAPVLMETYGRKRTLLFMSIFLVVGDLLAFWAYFLGSFVPMVIGRLLTGMTTGGCLNVFTVYTTEVAPHHLRGQIGVIGMIFRSFGMIMAVVCGLDSFLGTVNYWPFLFLIPAIISLIGPICLLACPESPRWLYITSGDVEGAIQSLRFYNGYNADLSETISELEIASSQYNGRLRVCDVVGNAAYWKPLVFSALFGCVIAFGGSHVMQNYSTVLVENAFIPAVYARHVNLVAFCVALPITFCMLPLIDRVGRKPLLVAVCSMIIAAECTLLVAFMMLNFEIGNRHILQIVIATTGISWVALVIGGLMSLNFIVSEIFPQNARSVGYSFHLVINFGMGAITTQCFEPLEHIAHGTGIAFLLVPMIAVTIPLLCFLPETSQFSIESLSSGGSPSLSRRPGFDASLVGDNGQMGYGSVGAHEDDEELLFEKNEKNAPKWIENRRGLHMALKTNLEAILSPRGIRGSEGKDVVSGKEEF